MIKKVLSNGLGQLVTGELLAAELKISRVQSLEVHQLVGHLVVVLQRVHQRSGSTPYSTARFRVSRRNSVSPSPSRGGRRAG